MDDWKITFLLGPGLFSGANCQFQRVVMAKNRIILLIVIHWLSEEKSNISKPILWRVDKKPTI